MESMDYDEPLKDGFSVDVGTDQRPNLYSTLATTSHTNSPPIDCSASRRTRARMLETKAARELVPKLFVAASIRCAGTGLI